jgi:hypothetical protein
MVDTTLISLFYPLRCLALRLGLVVLFPVLAWSQGTYTTNFLLTENPISESGRWIDAGAVTAGTWHSVHTTTNKAFGTMVGNETGNALYSDPTAVLSGAWNANQSAAGTVFVNTSVSGVDAEVELRLNTTIAPNSITGYEIDVVLNGYVNIVRWNGPVGNFTFVGPQNNNWTRAFQTGDVISASNTNGTINVTINGSPFLSVTDHTYSNGSPGIGFYLEGTTGLSPDFGFSSFTATGGGASASGSPAAPTNLRIVQ